MLRIRLPGGLIITIDKNEIVDDKDGEIAKRIIRYLDSYSLRRSKGDSDPDPEMTQAEQIIIVYGGEIVSEN